MTLSAYGCSCVTPITRAARLSLPRLSAPRCTTRWPMQSLDRVRRISRSPGNRRHARTANPKYAYERVLSDVFEDNCSGAIVVLGPYRAI